jgi:hypothetical protein
MACALRNFRNIAGTLVFTMLGRTSERKDVHGGGKRRTQEVNLFVDHSQIVQIECLRSGIWGTKNLWGRALPYKGEVKR